MRKLTLAELELVCGGGVGQDSADYNGPDGGQDTTQYGYGPDTIEFRAQASSSAFFSWADMNSAAYGQVHVFLDTAPDDATARAEIASYASSHGIAQQGVSASDAADIIVTAFHSTFGSLPVLDAYTTWYNTGFSGSFGSDGHLVGTQAGDFHITGAVGTDLQEVQGALDYLHNSPKAMALLSWAAANHIEIRIVHNGVDGEDPSGTFITWDPESALTLSDGHVQSAAIGLIHELAHAYEDPAGAPWLSLLPTDPDYAAYHYVQERDAIKNWEDPVAADLGDFGRTSYTGTVTPVDHSTTHH